MSQQKKYRPDHESGDEHQGAGGWSGPLPVKIDAESDGAGVFALLSYRGKDYAVTGPTIEDVQDRIRVLFGRHKYRWRIKPRAVRVSVANGGEDW